MLRNALWLVLFLLVGVVPRDSLDGLAVLLRFWLECVTRGDRIMRIMVTQSSYQGLKPSSLLIFIIDIIIQQTKHAQQPNFMPPHLRKLHLFLQYFEKSQLLILMIDLLKNYKELRTGPGYISSIQYYLAKKKLDTLFVKWLSSNQEIVEELIKKAQSGKLKASEQPNPLFSHHKVPINNPHMNASSINFNNTVTPPRASFDEKENTYKRAMNESQSLIRSTVLGKSLHHQVSVSTSEIPQFYFPNGKPIDTLTEQTYKASINTAIAGKNEITPQLAKNLTVNVLGLPNYFSSLLLIRCTGNPQATKATKQQFLKLWKDLESQTPQSRAFYLISSQPKKKYATPNDFKVLFKQILEIHPGLNFLKDTPEFQEWYSLCVIHRMFYVANRKYDYKMSFREFKKSNILKSLFDIEAEPDINLNPDFFSYEDFYVIYIRFWELDNDHDFQLSREELSKYSGYTLSRKTLERIFSQTVKKFEFQEKMGFGDFVWFILCVEDKTTEQSIQYWFKIMDLDGNGIITGYELEYFYQQQSQRLSYMQSNLDFNFQNIVCQMVDLFKPANGIQFTLEDFLKRKSDCSVFINMLTDLNKLIGFEQRDAYEDRNVKVENPNWTDWDRFVKPEYRRIESAQENDQGGEVLNWEHDD